MNALLASGLTPTQGSSHDLQEGVASLSRGDFFKEASLDMTLSILTESAAQTTGVERVSIWALTDEHEELRCLELFERSSGRHRSGGSLRATQYPAYFRALGKGQCIAADDAYLHPSTQDFAGDYLPTTGVTAMLATPIHIRGELQGVLCLEQVANRFLWTSGHRLFAQAVSNLVTLALVEFEAEQARQQVRNANERLRAVFEGSRDALLLIDGDSGLILDANRQAEILFACSRAALIGRHQRSLHPEKPGEAPGSFSQMIQDRFQFHVRNEILRSDGSVRQVEISAEIADTSDGRKLVMGIFRPL
jgi:PAS domain S-box-containing protein